MTKEQMVEELAKGLYLATTNQHGRTPERQRRLISEELMPLILRWLREAKLEARAEERKYQECAIHELNQRLELARLEGRLEGHSKSCGLCIANQHCEGARELEGQIEGGKT